MLYKYTVQIIFEENLLGCFVQFSKLKKIETDMFNRVYFDGTIETAGNVFQACAGPRRVWIVVPRNSGNEVLDTAHSFCDIVGSLGHFEQGRYIKHQSRGSARFLSTEKDGVELFFAWLAEQSAGDEIKLEFIGKFYACMCSHHDTEDGCAMCKHIDIMSQRYGFYDVLELVRSF